MLLTRTTRQGPARQSPPTSSRPGSAVSSVRTIALARDSDRHGDDAQASVSPAVASSKGVVAQLVNDDDGAFSSELPLAAARARCSTTGSLPTSTRGCVQIAEIGHLASTDKYFFVLSSRSIASQHIAQAAQHSVVASFGKLAVRRN